MGNCKDCQFWDTDTYKDVTLCNFVDMSYLGDKIPNDGFAVYARADDDSGLNYGLKTGPMFGCVRFVAKIRSDENVD